MNWKLLLSISTTVLIPVVAIGFIVVERVGLVDSIAGLDGVEEVAGRMESSYQPGVDRRIGPDERAWPAIRSLIDKYSTAELPSNQEPTALARFVAIASGSVQVGPDQFAEWTAPTTPIALIYGPIDGSLQASDVVVVGDIGDLRDWMERRRADIRFWFLDIVIALLLVFLSASVVFAQYKSRTALTGGGRPSRRE